MATNSFPIPIRYPVGMNNHNEADAGEGYSPTTHYPRRASLDHRPVDDESHSPLRINTKSPSHRRSGSEGSIDIPRNYMLPSPMAVFQHIRRSSSLGSNEYSYTPSNSGEQSSRSTSVSSGSSDIANSPPSQAEPSSPPAYFWTQFSPTTTATSAAALKRAQSLGANYHNCPGESCVCSHHHHRRNSVAIKFSPTYLEDPFYEDEATKTTNAQSEMEARNDAYGRAIRRHSTSTLHRPPTPIAERILKGDFTF